MDKIWEVNSELIDRRVYNFSNLLIPFEPCPGPGPRCDYFFNKLGFIGGFSSSLRQLLPPFWTISSFLNSSLWFSKLYVEGLRLLYKRNLGVSLDGSALRTPLYSSFKCCFVPDDEGLKISSNLIVFFYPAGGEITDSIWILVSVSEITFTGGSYFNLLKSNANP